MLFSQIVRECVSGVDDADIAKRFEKLGEFLAEQLATPSGPDWKQNKYYDTKQNAQLMGEYGIEQIEIISNLLSDSTRLFDWVASNPDKYVAFSEELRALECMPTTSSIEVFVSMLTPSVITEIVQGNYGDATRSLSITLHTPSMCNKNRIETINRIYPNTISTPYGEKIISDFNTKMVTLTDNTLK